jgi:hypothetical protein
MNFHKSILQPDTQQGLYKIVRACKHFLPANSGALECDRVTRRMQTGFEWTDEQRQAVYNTLCDSLSVPTWQR